MEALHTFLTRIDNNHSVLVDQLDHNQLTLEDVTARVKRSIISIFEERCERTRLRKAVWMFNRETGKATVTKLYNTKGRK